MKLPLIALLAFIGWSNFANAQNLLWAKKMGGVNEDGGSSIALDASGNVYTTGAFSGTANFDPGAGTFNLISNGSNDIFVSKLDASGNFVWAKGMGGANEDSGSSIALDASGNVFTIGSFTGTADFDPGAGTFNLISNGSDDIFVSKLDASGNFVWAKNMGGTSSAGGYSIAIDASGNVYTTGFFEGTADFDPGVGTFNLTSVGGQEIFISKLDASGNFVWAKRMGGVNGDGGSAIAIDASGNVYTTGHCFGIGDYDPGAGSYNLTASIFISKLDASGNFVWAKGVNGTGGEEGYSIAIDAMGNVYIGGYFQGTADFDPGAGIFNLTSAGGPDIFISKLDASGNFVWAKRIGGVNSDYACDIALDASGNVYATASFAGTADFDPGVGTFNLTSLGGQDIFISKLDASGNFVWTKGMGGTGSDMGARIALDASGNVFVTGFFQGTVDFDPGAGTFDLTSAGPYDIFVIKLSSSTTGINDFEFDKNPITVYPNPTNGVFSVKSVPIFIGTNIEIVNMLGEKIYSEQVHSDKTEIDLNKQPKGIYFLSLVADGKIIAITKLVITH